MVKNEQKLVEVARSFSYKLNTGNYQSVDFFASQKVECLESEASEKSEALYQWVKGQVMKAVNEFKAELADPLAKVKQFVASGNDMTVSEWEALTAEEQAFLQGVKKANNRESYQLQKEKTPEQVRMERLAAKQKSQLINVKNLDDVDWGEPN